MSILAGLGYSLKNMIETIEINTKLKIKKIFVSGGLSRINIINQLKADITGKTVVQLNNYETTSIGAAIWIEKIINGTDLKKLQKKYIRLNKIYTPNKVLFKKYKKFYKIFKNLNFLLKKTHHDNYDLKNQLKKNNEISLDNL